MLKPIVQCSCIGYLGMFGNQMLQYTISRCYAELYNSEFRAPKDWIGRKIFNLDDNTNLDPKLPRVDEKDLKFGQTNIDLHGFFQSEKFYKILDLTKFRKWFTIQDKWLELFPKRKPFYIAAHVRRGDMAKMHWSYPTFIEDSYTTSAISNGYDPNDIYWVREDSPAIHSICDNEGISFLPDFMTIYNADVVFRACSTFSFCAALLNPNCKLYSPIHDFPAYGAVGRIHTLFNLGYGPGKECLGIE